MKLTIKSKCITAVAIILTILTISSNIIYSDTTPRWTGLLIDEIDRKGDRKLAAAIENELKSYGLVSAALPSVLDYSHSEFLPPVGEQNENSCVAWSSGYYLRTFQQGNDIGWLVKEPGNGISSRIFSPSFIYNQIRQGIDGGAYIDDAGELLKNIGAATLENFPYIPGDIYTMPGESVIQSAHPHRIREWKLLYSDIDYDSYIIQKTKEYLNTGDLVVAGNRIGQKFQCPHIDNEGNSIIIREYNPPYMHAFVIVGYDDTLATPNGIGAFKLVNSWGTSWGNDGFSYISYEAFAANALEGYVFTDLVNRESQELAVDINDSVIFNMDFSGTGRFDFKIKSITNQLIYEENGLQGVSGLNSLVWNGRDMAGNSVGDGVYRFSIIPYKGNTPKPAFIKNFNKTVKVQSASACAYRYENVIQYVDIPIDFKAGGVLNIKVDYSGTVHELVTNEAVEAGESSTYTIYKKDFDFNNIDLNKVRIIIGVS